MKWLLRRLSIVCVSVGVFCSTPIVLGRLNGAPDKLQALGLGMCDGEPCFRGIKVGTDWASVLALFPRGVMQQGYLYVRNGDGVHYLFFHPSADRATVD